MRKTTHHGFTLIETLVAISLLLVGVVGPMTIAAQGLQNAFYAREQVTAYSLGQESIELVRAVRDENAIAGSSWLTGIPAACDRDNGDGCGIDVSTITFIDCGDAADACVLNYDNGALSGARGMYSHEPGDATPFIRRMWVDEIVANREVEVTVEVIWSSNLFSADRTVTLQTRLFNHYDNL